MARPLRIERVGCWYHITARGMERRDVFRDDQDRRYFLDLLESAVGMFALRLHAYVLMSDRYHLLVEITETNLSRAIHWLNVSYTVWFNQRHGRSGHLLHGRFKSIVVDPEGWGLEVSRYLHLGPVRPAGAGPGKARRKQNRRAGFGKLDRAQGQEQIRLLRQFPWSSYRAYAGGAKKPSWLTTKAVLRLAGRTNPVERYRKYCEEAVRQGTVENPWNHVVGQMVLGSERFVAQLAASLETEAGDLEAFQTKVSLGEVIGAVEAAKGEKWQAFRDRYGDPGRDMVLYLGRMRGMSTRELSKGLGINYATAAAAFGRMADRVKKERPLARLLTQATAHLKQD